MILLAIIGFFIPIFLGFGITRFFFRELDAYEQIMSSAALGIGFFTFLFFILNQFFNLKFNFLTSVIFMIVLFVLSCVLLLLSKRKDGLNDRKSGRINRIGHCKSRIIKARMFFKNFFRENKLVKVIIIIMLLLITYKSLFFPIISVDGLEFYVPIMNEIFHTGSMPLDVGPQVSEFTRAYPPLFYILGAWVSILNQNVTEIIIKFLPAFFGFLTLIAVYTLAKNLVFNDKRKALLACFLLLSFPMFVNYSVYMTNDTILAFFAVAGTYFVMKYLICKVEKYLFLGFIIFGMLINTKMLGVPLFVSVFLALFFIVFYKRIADIFNHKNSFGKILKSKDAKIFMLAIIFLIIIIAPYFIRNYLFFNDPLYPYLSASSFFHGKNFVPSLFAPLTEFYEKVNIFSSAPYALYSVANFIRSKDYSMSLFFITLLFLIMINFKKLNNQQKYLLYFSIFFTLYFVYSFMLVYRYYMAIIALLCVVVASKFDDILQFRLKKKEKIAILLFLILFIAVSIIYIAILIYKSKVIQLLGPLASHFLTDIDVMVVIHLSVVLLCLLVIVLKRSIKVSAFLLILLLSIPSLYSLAIINYGITKETTGVIDHTKDLSLFKQELRFIPSKDAVLKMNLGDSYDAQLFLKNFTPKDAVILSYVGVVYYSERTAVNIGSYKVAGTYNSSIEDTMRILHRLNISYVLYKKPGWDEYVFNRNDMLEKSAITQNINNTKFFERAYNNSQYFVYSVK